MVADTAVNMEADNVVDKVAGIVADMADDKKMSLPDMLLNMVADKKKTNKLLKKNGWHGVGHGG